MALWRRRARSEAKFARAVAPVISGQGSRTAPLRTISLETSWLAATRLR